MKHFDKSNVLLQQLKKFLTKSEIYCNKGRFLNVQKASLFLRNVYLVLLKRTVKLFFVSPYIN